VLPTQEEVTQILMKANADSLSARALLEAVPVDRKLSVSRSLAWMLKMGLLRRV